jgi:hypothetical protein
MAQNLMSSSNEFKIRAEVLKGSIVGVGLSLAAKVAGYALGIGFVGTVGQVGFYTSMTCGFISGAGMIANIGEKAWGVKGENIDDKSK